MTRGAMDIAANRRAQKYAPREQLARVAWAIACPLLFRPSPRPLWAWRNLVLRAFGARVGRHVRVSNTARIAMPWQLRLDDWCAVGDDVRLYSLGTIRIGRAATISQGAHLCAGTHDDADPSLPLIRKGIAIGASAWVCADAFVGPGVRVGEGAVGGARAVAVRDVPPWTVVAGNPARRIRERVLRRSP